MKKKSNFKIFKVMKSTSKTRFNHLLHEKNSIWRTLCYYFYAFDQKFMVLLYQNTILVQFTMLAPVCSVAFITSNKKA